MSTSSIQTVQAYNEVSSGIVGEMWMLLIVKDCSKLSRMLQQVPEATSYGLIVGH